MGLFVFEGGETAEEFGGRSGKERVPDGRILYKEQSGVVK